MAVMAETKEAKKATAGVTEVTTMESQHWRRVAVRRRSSWAEVDESPGSTFCWLQHRTRMNVSSAPTPVKEVGSRG